MLRITSVSYSERGVQVVTFDRYAIGYALGYNIAYKNLVHSHERGFYYQRALRALPPVTRGVKLVDIRSNRDGFSGETQYSWEWDDA